MTTPLDLPGIAARCESMDGDIKQRAQWAFADRIALLSAIDGLRKALELAAVRLEICAGRMRGCNSEGGKHELVDEVDDFAREARAQLSALADGKPAEGGE